MCHIVPSFSRKGAHFVWLVKWGSKCFWLVFSWASEGVISSERVNEQQQMQKLENSDNRGSLCQYNYTTPLCQVVPLCSESISSILLSNEKADYIILLSNQSILCECLACHFHIGDPYLKGAFIGTGSLKKYTLKGECILERGQTQGEVLIRKQALNGRRVLNRIIAVHFEFVYVVM